VISVWNNIPKLQVWLLPKVNKHWKSNDYQKKYAFNELDSQGVL